MAFTEDVSVYFDTKDGFAEVVTVDGNPVDAIVDLPSKDSPTHEDFEPSIICVKADVPTAAQGIAVVARTVNYQITNIDPEETDLIVTLYLEEV